MHIYLEKVEERQREETREASEFMFTTLMQIREKQNAVSGVKSVGVLSTSLLNIWAWVLSSLHQKLCHDICAFWK